MRSPDPNLRQPVLAISEDDASFGAALYAHRLGASMTQAEVATRAGVSNSYYSSIENGKRFPPPRRTAVRLARAVGLSGRNADALVAQAVLQRGTDRRDEDLPPDVRLLIRDLRTYAFTIPSRFVAGLRAKLREAVP